MKGIFYGIGVGPGDPELVTRKAIRALEALDILIVPSGNAEGRSEAHEIARGYLPESVRVISRHFPMTKDAARRDAELAEIAREIAELAAQDLRVGFATIGDPTVYSTYAYLLRQLRRVAPDVRCETIPGITSFSAIAGALNQSLAEGDEPLIVYPCSAEDAAGRVRHLLAEGYSLVLMKVYRNFEAIREAIESAGMTDYAVVSSNFGKSGEITAPLRDYPRSEISYFTTILVKPRGREKSPVVFVGAGPGDPGLITVKGARALESADIVVYAGSLVNPEILSYCGPQAALYDSAGLDLEQTTAIIAEGYAAGRKVVRLHTGDFSIYGSIREQIEALSERGVPYELVAGVSSFLGAASSLSIEYTVPEISQSVIVTRIAGRTPVPESESIRSFAAHRASMCIFLSADRIDDVVAELIAGGYPADTPAAVVYRATWKDEKIVRGTLGDIAASTRAAGITRHALILVGRALGDEYNFSKLYDKYFTHGYRRGRKKEAGE